MITPGVDPQLSCTYNQAALERSPQIVGGRVASAEGREVPSLLDRAQDRGRVVRRVIDEALPGEGETITVGTRVPGPQRSTMMSESARRLKELGQELPAPFPPYGNYVMAARSGRLLVSTGHVPVDGERAVTGKLGRDLSTEEGYEAARLAARSWLATFKAELGDLDRIDHLVYLYGIVNAADDLTQHTAVIDGASDLLVQVLGEAGRHAPLSVGVSSLPGNVAVEIQVVADSADDTKER